jgi:hypothetical protein
MTEEAVNGSWLAIPRMPSVPNSWELKEFRSSGVQEFRSSGVQEFRSSGVQEFRSSGVQEFRSSVEAGAENCKKKGSTTIHHDCQPRDIPYRLLNS